MRCLVYTRSQEGGAVHSKLCTSSASNKLSLLWGNMIQWRYGRIRNVSWVKTVNQILFASLLQWRELTFSPKTSQSLFLLLLSNSSTTANLLSILWTFGRPSHCWKSESVLGSIVYLSIMQSESITVQTMLRGLQKSCASHMWLHAHAYMLSNTFKSPAPTQHVHAHGWFVLSDLLLVMQSWAVCDSLCLRVGSQLPEGVCL